MSSQKDTLRSIFFIGCCTLICSILLIILSWQLFKSKDERSRGHRRRGINILSKILVFSCVLISTLCAWSDLIRHIICYIQNKDLYYYPLNNIMCFADFLYYLGNVLFYIIAISRLQISFHGSQYAIHCPILSFFYTLIGMFDLPKKVYDQQIIYPVNV